MTPSPNVSRIGCVYAFAVVMVESSSATSQVTSKRNEAAYVLFSSKSRRMLIRSQLSVFSASREPETRVLAPDQCVERVICCVSTEDASLLQQVSLRMVPARYYLWFQDCFCTNPTPPVVIRFILPSSTSHV